MLFTNIFAYLRAVISQKEGQAMVEYILLVGLIALIVVVALLVLGPAIADKFNEAADQLA